MVAYYQNNDYLCIRNKGGGDEPTTAPTKITATMTTITELENIIKTIRAAITAQEQATANGNTTTAQYMHILAATALDDASRALCNAARSTHAAADAERAAAATAEATRKTNKAAAAAESNEAEATTNSNLPNTLTAEQRNAREAAITADPRTATNIAQAIHRKQQQINGLKGWITNWGQRLEIACQNRNEKAIEGASKRLREIRKQLAEAEEEMAALKQTQEETK